MKKQMATRLLAQIRDVAKRFRLFSTRGSARRDMAPKSSNEGFKKELLNVALEKRTSLRRLMLALRSRPVARELAPADEDAPVDYGGEFLEAGEDPNYFARQAKQRKRVAVEARRLARRQRSQNSVSGLDRLPAAPRRQLARGWKR